MKKIILCYGDSNTYGYNPSNGLRYNDNERWSGILKKELSDDYELIEEGKNNRTAAADNLDGFEYSAQRHFPKFISKMPQIDILILALGSNDLQFQFDLSYKNIERGIETLIECAKKHKTKNIILVPPVKIKENVLNGYFRFQFDETSVSKARNVDRVYKKLARILNCIYVDFNDFVKPSNTDGLHYNKEEHLKIAKKLKDIILNIDSTEKSNGKYK